MTGYLIVAAVAAVVGVSHGDLCNPSEQILLSQENSWCDTMGQGSARGSADSCCAGAVESSTRLLLGDGKQQSRNLDHDLCRSIALDAPYCDDASTNCAQYLSANDLLTIDLGISAGSSTSSCCPTCSCVGDPECVSFDGQSDEWIVCDGRSNNTCTVTRYRCNRKKDHQDNQCVYLKDDPNWIDFETSGSGCQPNWAVSGYPTMTMYEVDDFKIVLTLGERGIITEAEITLSPSRSVTLKARDCFATPNNAWSGSIPSTWSKTEANGEVSWNIQDLGGGIFVNIVCTSGLTVERARLDFQSLIDTNTVRVSRSAGFCASGSISEKNGLREREHVLHQRCLALNLPELLATCKYVVGATCRPSNMDAMITEWCNKANLAGSSVATAGSCASALLAGSEKERSALWTELVCELNGMDIESCVTKISQFGWPDFTGDFSGGAGTKEVEPVECYSGTYEVNEDECAEGAAVEYLKDGAWQQAFFVPVDMPPCAPIVVNAGEYPELFMYEVRVSQCDIKPECLVANSCRETPSISVEFDFETTTCPTPNPTVSPTPSPTRCDLSTEAGNLVSQTEIVAEQYTVTTVMNLDRPTCTGSDANVIHYGCDANMPYFVVDIQDCSENVIVKVGLQNGDVLRCRVTNALKVGEDVSVVAAISEETFTVSVDGELKCTRQLNGRRPLNNGRAEDVCLYSSAPERTSANLCEHDVSIDNEFRCIPATEAGNLVSEEESVAEEYTVTTVVNLDRPTVCTGSDANVVHYGCDADMPYFAVDIKDCSTDVVVKVGLENGDVVRCRENDALKSGEDVTIVSSVIDKVLTVTIDGTEVCRETLSALPLNNGAEKDVCLYTSAPNSPAAELCGFEVQIENEPPRCEKSLVAGELVSDSETVTESYVVTTVMNLDRISCVGDDANVVHYGCNANRPMFAVDIKDCSRDVIVIVGLEGGGTVDCTIADALVDSTDVSVVSTVGKNALVVTVDGTEVCRESLGGGTPLNNGDSADVCVYQSAPGRPVGNLCSHDISIENVDDRCELSTTPGNLVSSTEVVSSNYTVEARLTYDRRECRGEDANVASYGCNPDVPFFAVDIRDCSETVVVRVGLQDGTESRCVLNSILTEGKEVVVGAVVITGTSTNTLTVTVDDVQVCQKTLSAEPLNHELRKDVCKYESAPGRPSAALCAHEVNIINNNFLIEQCSCEDGDAQPKICTDTSSSEVSLGRCDECCVEPSTIGREGLQCREVTMFEPYCDLSMSTEVGKCPLLETEDGTLEIKIALETDIENTCCENCICYGDPECVDFSGSTDEWILCDARDENCVVDKDICLKQRDHAGNQCTWNQDIADRLENKLSNIGAYGSPCVPNFEESGPAYMTMYQFDDFRARLSMGERGVIETLEITNADGTYTLIADECFTNEPWESIASVPLEDSLTVVEGDQRGFSFTNKEKTLEITDKASGVFFRVLCIKAVASDNKNQVSFRMNIENLIEPNTVRPSTSGYCSRENSVIDTLDSTRDNTDKIYEQCLSVLADEHEICKELWSQSCTRNQIKAGVEQWCAHAVLYPGDSNRVEKCIDFIGTNPRKWEQAYCDSVNALRPNSMTVSDWRDQCVSRLGVEGYKSVISELGRGTLDSNGPLLCAPDISAYSTRENDCTPGVSVEYQKKNGNWVEAFFMPATMPPCDNVLKISASSHYNLFTRPIRFRQCEIDAGLCAQDLGCFPMFDMDIKLTYDQNAQVCA